MRSSEAPAWPRDHEAVPGKLRCRPRGHGRLRRRGATRRYFLYLPLTRFCRRLRRSAARVAGGDQRSALQIGSLHLSARSAGVQKAGSFFFPWCSVADGGRSGGVRRGAEGAGDQRGPVVRLRGPARVAASGGQPRRLLPAGPQRAGERGLPVMPSPSFSL